MALGRDTKLLRELINQTAERLSKDLAGQPEVEADLRETLGGVYLAISEFDQAEAMDREALRLRRKLSGPGHLAVARVLDHLAEVLRQKGGKLEQAAAMSGEALAIRRQRLGNEHLDVASSLVTLGNVLRGKANQTEAEAVLREAVGMRRKLLGNAHPDVADALSWLALSLQAKSGLPRLNTICP